MDVGKESQESLDMGNKALLSSGIPEFDNDVERPNKTMEIQKKESPVSPLP